MIKAALSYCAFIDGLCADGPAAVGDWAPSRRLSNPVRHRPISSACPLRRRRLGQMDDRNWREAGPQRKASTCQDCLRRSLRADRVRRRGVVRLRPPNRDPLQCELLALTAKGNSDAIRALLPFFLERAKNLGHFLGQSSRSAADHPKSILISIS
jgi:hypothetical protein